MKTNKGLVEYAQAQLGKPYWYGTYGQEASKNLYNQKKNQYPAYYKWAYGGEKGVKVHDCVGLIKGYLWSETPDSKPKYNGAQDKSANGMRAACKVSGTMATFPATVGTLVFFDGHVGVYEGNGYVLEARGHDFGVVRTQLNKRGWKWWGYCPDITYEDIPQDKPQPQPTYKPTVLEWQLAAIADGFTFPQWGADGEWGKECETVAAKAIVKKRLTYKYHNLTKIVQKVVGVVADGKCGTKTAQAIKEYQAANGLTADGKCGLNTWRVMIYGTD